MTADQRLSLVRLVDSAGAECGEMDVESAHRYPGHRHLAFSAFLFNDSGELLLQRRAQDKSRFPGLWTNTCCSHPPPGIELRRFAQDRLTFEMGIVAELTRVGQFQYRAVDPTSGEVEDEFDVVLVGRWEGSPCPNPREVDDVDWMTPERIRAEVGRGALAVTPWLLPALTVALSS